MAQENWADPPDLEEKVAIVLSPDQTSIFSRGGKNTIQDAEIVWNEDSRVGMGDGN